MTARRTTGNAALAAFVLMIVLLSACGGDGSGTVWIDDIKLLKRPLN